MPYLFYFVFFLNDTATTEIYTTRHTLSLHDALPISPRERCSAPSAHRACAAASALRSEEHTSELQSRLVTSYAVFCLKKKKHTKRSTRISGERRRARESSRDNVA